MTKKIASISLDLDNQWSYMKIHGDEGWEKFPSYLDIFVPYVLDILDELQLKITFFIVGQDAAIEENQKYLKMIADRGHEVGNHSFHHESWLQTYSREKIEEEIVRA
jgi:peptidoglycan/xylan/chitin deacetylase (PgdA/CDA1 family)